MTVGVWLLFAALAIGGGFSAWQARALVGRGSDHLVHLFLVRAIRTNRHRLFTRIPGLINPSYCGAYPLYLHWLLAWLPDSALLVAARWLGPLLVCAQTCALFASLRFLGFDDTVAGWSSVLLALTPQFYHAYSARNYGLSSRIIGLLLFMFLGLCVGYAVDRGSDYALVWLGAALLGYLIWGFNTFTQQAMILTGVVLALLGNWMLLAAAAGGLVIFVLLHPKYSISYIIHTFRFVHAYATEVAAAFILRQRPSLWRDLVYDIWKKICANRIKGLSYGYANSVLIAVFLNPLVSASGVLWLMGRFGDAPVAATFAKISFAAVVVSFATSFRITRFLGEPERYLEAATPFAAAAMAIHSVQSGRAWLLPALGGYFLAVNILQLQVIRMQKAATNPVFAQIREVESTIRKSGAIPVVRLCCNNEEITKQLMGNPWTFFRLWAGGQRYAGVSFGEACKVFPFLTTEFFSRVVIEYRANICVLDREAFWEFQIPPGATGEELMKSERLRVIRLNWPEGCEPSAGWQTSVSK